MLLLILKAINETIAVDFSHTGHPTRLYGLELYNIIL